MCTYINFFPACRYIAQALSNFVLVVQKRLGMNKFVLTKSPTGSKFSKIFFSAVVYRMDCSCAPILRFFSVASDGATTERQILNRVSGQFRTSLKKDSVANYSSILTLFSTAVTGPDVLCNALNVSQIRL